MRRDLIIGVIGSLAINAGAVLISQWGKSGPPKPHKEDALTIQVMEMPKIEPDEPDPVEETQVNQQTELAPPMQTDVPQVPTLSSFTQEVEPPPPDVSINRSALTVSQNTNWRGGMQVFNLDQLDQKPVPTYQPQPQYPFEMRRAGISGTVTVDFIVDSTGTVINAYAIKSTQHDFEQNAVQGVSRWRFKPGKRAGRAVPTHMQIDISFTLDQS
jgi:protein TonB